MYKSLSAPLAVQLEFSEACTHDCVHCYNYWRSERAYGARNLPRVDAQVIADQFIASKVFRVVATGGEPLMNREVLFETIDKLRTADVVTIINSNLVLLTEEDVYLIKNLGVSSVLTSILGPEACIHDEITGYSGSFEKTVNGINMLKRVGVKVGVNMVVTKKNNKLIKETALYVRSMGLKSFFATKAGCPGNYHDFSKLRIDISEFRRYLEDLYLIEEPNFITDVLEAYPLCGIKDINRYRAAANHRCLAGVTTMTIGVDGNVRPCSHLDVVCGNVIDKGLSFCLEKYGSMERKGISIRCLR